ncbi:MAG: NFYB/HAP3 family transcription factor subunit [Candidatus Parvarchaeota archaeon]|nr:NFYB/HAP3 family transcription factor subunit [Candidatus Jingweiarchaeum tengchongense]MCW1298018.1 NFYB/HAP3 family transcription factor subunit [Candidatus Jingweiarchaeum tengchongense]MCW1300182.1 NFYB/HAP3 family transcription factor subunit [Candidatus Jingweiarchaeum tengchongense]MCW1304392.1 NFYB/HAP3 family transcription factor subunit [Candidatus Jingweiarchaeum tengchongense]MCW1310944.1 NFYB/HAP3 family transcription factor subunit [Candidatus Jingweiarchaeum tengchongense]
MKQVESMGLLALATLEKLMREVGSREGVNRVSIEAVKKMAEILEEVGVKISESAVKMASHAGRKTIKSDDIKLVKLR